MFILNKPNPDPSAIKTRICILHQYTQYTILFNQYSFMESRILSDAFIGIQFRILALLEFLKEFQSGSRRGEYNFDWDWIPDPTIRNQKGFKLTNFSRRNSYLLYPLTVKKKWYKTNIILYISESDSKVDTVCARSLVNF